MHSIRIFIALIFLIYFMINFESLNYANFHISMIIIVVIVILIAPTLVFIQLFIINNNFIAITAVQLAFTIALATFLSIDLFDLITFINLLFNFLISLHDPPNSTAL